MKYRLLLCTFVLMMGHMTYGMESIDRMDSIARGGLTDCLNQYPTATLRETREALHQLAYLRGFNTESGNPPYIDEFETVVKDHADDVKKIFAFLCPELNLMPAGQQLDKEDAIQSIDTLLQDLGYKRDINLQFDEDDFIEMYQNRHEFNKLLKGLQEIANIQQQPPQTNTAVVPPPRPKIYKPSIMISLQDLGKIGSITGRLMSLGTFNYMHVRLIQDHLKACIARDCATLIGPLEEINKLKNKGTAISVKEKAQLEKLCAEFATTQTPYFTLSLYTSSKSRVASAVGTFLVSTGLCRLVDRMIYGMSDPNPSCTPIAQASDLHRHAHILDRTGPTYFTNQYKEWFKKIEIDLDDRSFTFSCYGSLTMHAASAAAQGCIVAPLAMALLNRQYHAQWQAYVLTNREQLITALYAHEKNPHSREIGDFVEGFRPSLWFTPFDESSSTFGNIISSIGNHILRLGVTALQLIV